MALDRVHSIIPLCLLRAMQDADHLPEVAGEPFGELASVRFGGSDTVAAQIDRYAGATRRGESVDVAEVVGLLNLVARRPDADLVLADAGRLAGEMAARGGRGPLARWVPGPLKRWMAGQAVRKCCRDYFAVTVRDDHDMVWRADPTLAGGSLGGATCRMIGSAAAEVLHVQTGFEGALFHVQCTGNGDEVCAWTTESQPEA